MVHQRIAYTGGGAHCPTCTLPRLAYYEHMAIAPPSRQEVVAGSLWSGLLATAIGHPLDCVKVRLQTAAASHLASAASSSARTTLGTARSMFKREGARAFTRGFLPPMLNSLTMNTVIFVGFVVRAVYLVSLLAAFFIIHHVDRLARHNG